MLSTSVGSESCNFLFHWFTSVRDRTHNLLHQFGDTSHFFNYLKPSLITNKLLASLSKHAAYAYPVQETLHMHIQYRRRILAKREHEPILQTSRKRDTYALQET